ncbi:MAG: ATP-binding protein [Clostridia bacterium]|nr:ATP-binding protein [Clostridia bacterium]
MDFYIKRIADKLLAGALKNFGAVYIKGPRACGKTTTSLQVAASTVNLQNPQDLDRVESVLTTNPDSLLDSPKPILFDEWQIEPRLWNTIASSVQKSENRHGAYILTGSSSLNVDGTADSAIGRISTIKMSTMSLYESGDSTGEISLHELIQNPDGFKEGCKSKLTKSDLIFTICRGGWPGCFDTNDKLEQLRYPQYVLDRILSTNLHLEDGSTQRSDLTMALLRSYGKNNCRLTKSEKIYKDVEDVEPDRTKVDMYVNALKSLYIIEEIDRWSLSPLSRESKYLPKHVVTEPSIAAAALNLDSSTLLKPEYSLVRGFLFENMCIRDIEIYASGTNTRVSYSFYRDEETKEVDIVLHDENGYMALIECKFAKKDIPEAEKNLLDLERKIFEKDDEMLYGKKIPDNISHSPLLKIILTGTEIAEKLNSGVLVIPLGCLKD